MQTGPSRVPWFVPVALFLWAIIWNWVPPQQDAMDNGWYESINVARSLAKNGSWANPMRTVSTGPTAHLAPAFPLLVSLLLHDNPGVVAMFYRLFNLELIGIASMCASLPVVAVALGMRWFTGAAAAAVLIVLPLGRAPQWESHLMGFLLAVLTVISLRFWHQARTTGGAVMVGLAWGVCLLMSANITIVLFLLSAASLLGGLRRRLLALAGLTAMVVVLPWMIRNLSQLGGFVPIRSNLGLELNVSNNPCAQPSFRANLRYHCFQTRHPNESASRGAQMRNMGELRYYNSLKVEATEWILANPGTFAQLTLRRWLLFWIPYDPQGPFSDAGLSISPHYAQVVTLATFLSIPGLLWLIASHPPAGIWLAAWLTGFPLVHYLVQFEARYRYPIIWMTFLLATHAVVTMIERSQAKFLLSLKSATSSPPVPGAHPE